MLKFFNDNDLICINQTGFKPIDSCLNQGLPITSNIYRSLDQGWKIIE